MVKTKTADKVLTRPPIVAVLGHVDHGKTTLLDTIRKTNITSGEAGGITQHIGAYQMTVSEQSSRPSKTSGGISSDKEILRQAQDDHAQSRTITFIDTPGHEAFAKMRSRGAQVADLALLVVAADDGVMPQTIESIKYIKGAGIPFIVVLNKTDLPSSDPDKVKQQLAKNGVLVEGFGGEIVVVMVSAKTGKGIPQLLEMISLVAEMTGIKTTSGNNLSALVIEAKLDKRRGNLATVILKNGVIKTGQTIYADSLATKVRAIHNDKGETINEAFPSQPVEIMGWTKLPAVGTEVTSTIQTKEQTQTARVIKPFSLPPLETVKKLKLIIKADVAGSLEAIKENLGTEGIEIILSATGDVSESDVLLAKSTGAFIIGFNVKSPNQITKLATLEKVKIKTYTIIYELLDEISEVVQLLNAPQATEEILGQATILAEFKSDEARVAGSRVTSGRIARGDTARLLRKDIEIGKARIKSLRHGKSDIPKAETNAECGVLFDKKLDFELGDSIIAYKTKELLA